MKSNLKFKSSDKINFDELKREIKSYSPEVLQSHGVLQPARDGKSYVCPYCGNGTGENGTGVSFTTSGDAYIFHCLRCNGSGDNLHILANHFNLSLQGDDFQKMILQSADLFGISTDSTRPKSKNKVFDFQPSQKDSAEIEKLQKEYKAYIEESQKNLPDFIKSVGGKYRGLTLETLQKFNCGFVQKYKYQVPPDSRLIMPNSEYSFSARHIDESVSKDLRFRKSAKVEHQIFNIDALTQGENILIVEGEIDCMSIWQATKLPCIALGGVANYDKLLNILDLNESIRPNFIILFDDDDAGHKNSKVLSEKLTTKNYKNLVKYLPSDEEKTDANKILKSQGDKKLAEIIFEILEDAKQIFDSEPDFESIKREIFNKLYWKNKARDTLKDFLENLEIIFENDPNLKGLIAYDEFSGQIVFTRKPVWNNDKNFKQYDCWRNIDDSEIKCYLEKNYKWRGSERKILNYIDTVAYDNSIHVVKKYLEKIPKWDGVPRAENLFIKAFGVDDTPYAREITMNWLIGALARINHPGCDYQTALVLQGKQGIGKSHILKLLGNAWHISLVSKVDDAHSLSDLQKGWIVELEELAAVKKVDVNNIKSFISRRADTFRAPYERKSETVKRHCVFAISCNDRYFLNDPTGNRRFAVLECKNQALDYEETINEEYIHQVWAEAIFKYDELFKNGFDETKLQLSRETRIKAEEVASDFVRDDGLEGLIDEFLNTKIPSQVLWNLLTQAERKRFFAENNSLSISEKVLSERLGESKYSNEEFKNALSQYEYHNEFITLKGTESRSIVSAVEIMNEMPFDGRIDARKINDVLSRLEGWDSHLNQYKTRPGYGRQKHTYTRIAEEISPTAEMSLPKENFVGTTHNAQFITQTATNNFEPNTLETKNINATEGNAPEKSIDDLLKNAEDFDPDELPF